jgi:hypothetical protein
MKACERCSSVIFWGKKGASISSEIFTEEEVASIVRGLESFVGAIGRFIERREAEGDIKGKGRAKE